MAKWAPEVPSLDRPNFTVQKQSVGNICFEGFSDLANIEQPHDVHARVKLMQGEIILYPDAELKPDVGEELNRPARVTLFNCRPQSSAPQTGVSKWKKAATDAVMAEKYAAKVRRMTENKGAEFVSYDYLEGIWVFRADHF